MFCLPSATETRAKAVQDTEVVDAQHEYTAIHMQLRHSEPSADLLTADRDIVIDAQLHVERARELQLREVQKKPVDEHQISEAQIALQKREPPVFIKPIRPSRVSEGKPLTYVKPDCDVLLLSWPMG